MTSSLLLLMDRFYKYFLLENCILLHKQEYEFTHKIL